MTRRSNSFFRAAANALIVLAIASYPSIAWQQEQTPAAAQEPPQQQTESPASSVPPADVQSTETATAPSAPAAEQKTAEAAPAEAARKYVIRAGDTLWDISNAFYRDPFLWPLIWKSNPSIDDPDLIYPGNALVIPSLAPVERAMEAPEAAPEKEAAEAVPSAPSALQQPGEEGAAPEKEAEHVAKLIVPEEAPVPLLDKFGMLSAWFVGDEDSPDRVLEAVMDPENTSLADGDRVFIRIKTRKEVDIGDKFLIYAPQHRVRHPINNRSYGKLYEVLGVLKVTAPNPKVPGMYRALIVQSFDAISPGNMLAPYQEPALIYPSSEKQTKDISGYILDVTDDRTLNGQQDFVFLDKGKEDGVDPGDRFAVYSPEHDDIPGTSTEVGEVQVILVKSRTATAIIRQSKDALERGERVEFKN